MDEASQKTFDEIIKTNPEDLTSDQKAFIFARRTYLTHAQEEAFKDILKAEEPVVEKKEK
jgi:hypothetical protein